MQLKHTVSLILFFMATVGCKKELSPTSRNNFYKEIINSEDREIITPEESKTYHTDTKRKYEYRTGNPGKYEYNYNVKGINAKGDSVFGNINTSDKLGAGILINDTLEDLEIKTEWISHGKLKAIDGKGNIFLLIVK